MEGTRFEPWTDRNLLLHLIAFVYLTIKWGTANWKYNKWNCIFVWQFFFSSSNNFVYGYDLTMPHGTHNLLVGLHTYTYIAAYESTYIVYIFIFIITEIALASFIFSFFLPFFWFLIISSLLLLLKSSWWFLLLTNIVVQVSLVYICVCMQNLWSCICESFLCTFQGLIFSPRFEQFVFVSISFAWNKMNEHCLTLEENPFEK